MEKFRSGYVSLTGRPNVGKSTMLNAILGEKAAIVTPKPQTTRNRIIGVKTLDGAQIVFIDTPGIHKPKHKLGEFIVKEAVSALKDVDVILFMVEPEDPDPGDKHIIDMLRNADKPVFLLINKIDTVKKHQLLSVIDAFSKLYVFKEIIPISAKTKDGFDILINTVVRYLSEGPKYYSDDVFTDQSIRFMAAEIIREKIMHHTSEEVPHSIAVDITRWEEGKPESEKNIVYISANIYVERDGQKGIIIGKNGMKLKDIGTAARIDVEGLVGVKVFLELWVKVKKDWRGNDNILKTLGFK